MAKRKKKNSTTPDVPARTGPTRTNISIDHAENGHIVHISREGGREGYSSKKFVAPNGRVALRIAGQHLAGASKARGGKKAKGSKRTAMLTKPSL